MDSLHFQKRTNYSGDLKTLVEKVISAYDLGELLDFSPILQGYEDFNFQIRTSTGHYLVKIMGAFRSDKEAEQYSKIMQLAIEAGVNHPRIYLVNREALFKLELDGVNLRLVVMDFVEGSDFFQLKTKPTRDEAIFLVSQAAKISQINFRPVPVYDSWAIPNFLTEYEKVKDNLEKEDLKYILPLVEIFPSLHLDQLPQAFVHGDIIATNVIRARDNQIYILDFAVANTYPRIQELAILLCDLLFEKDQEKYLANYNVALSVYQKTLELEPEEIIALPTLIKLAHAMHIIGAVREKIKGTTLPENDFWLQSGQEGIRVAANIWK